MKPQAFTASQNGVIFSFLLHCYHMAVLGEKWKAFPPTRPEFNNPLNIGLKDIKLNFWNYERKKNP